MSRSIRTKVAKYDGTINFRSDYRTQLNQMGGMRRFVELGNGRFRATRYYHEGRKAEYTFYPTGKSTFKVHLVATGITSQRAMRDIRRAVEAKPIGAGKEYPAPESTYIASALLVIPGDFLERLSALGGYLTDVSQDNGIFKYVQHLEHPHKHSEKRPVNVVIKRRMESRKGPGKWIGEFNATAEHSGDDLIALENFVLKMGARPITPETFSRLSRGTIQ